VIDGAELERQVLGHGLVHVEVELGDLGFLESLAFDAEGVAAGTDVDEDEISGGVGLRLVHDAGRCVGEFHRRVGNGAAAGVGDGSVDRPGSGLSESGKSKKKSGCEKRRRTQAGTNHGSAPFATTVVLAQSYTATVIANVTWLKSYSLNR